MKKFISYLTVALTCLAFLGANTLLAQEWTKEQKEVWKTIEDSWEAWKTGDVDKTFDFIHDKYMGWNNEQPLPMSKDQWMKSYNMNKDYMKVQSYNLNPARIVVDGNNAVVHYYFDFYITITKGDKQKEKGMSGKNAEFYVRQNGNWLLLGDMTYIDHTD